MDEGKEEGLPVPESGTLRVQACEASLREYAVGTLSAAVAGLYIFSSFH